MLQAGIIRETDDWDKYAAEEAAHLASDMIILFPITNETYAIGSLTESGYNFLQAMKLDDRREFVIYIAPDVNPGLDSEKGFSKAYV